MTSENNEKDFPGYPHYPAKEDLMDKRNGKAVDMDVENMNRKSKVPSDFPELDNPDETMTGDAELNGSPTSEVNDSDITSDDLLALGESERQYGLNIGKEGEELDVPGSEDDDENEKIGSEDEENNYYSLGGDAHENLDEDRGE